MESVKTMQPNRTDYQVVSEVDLKFGCDWSVDHSDKLIRGTVEMTTEGKATETFLHLCKPSLITKEFLESKLCNEKLDSDYEGLLEIFIQQQEYWMDLSSDVRRLLLPMIGQGAIERPEHLQ